jgi:hypothetical protein
MDEPSRAPLTTIHGEASLLACFEPTRIEVDCILPEIPDNRLEARRVITREWAIDPTPDELQAIVRVAHDPAGGGGLPRELARATLAARIFVNRAVRKLLEPDALDAERVREVAQTLPSVVRGIDALEEQLCSIGAIVTPDQRDFLKYVADLLTPSRDLLVAAAVLAPYLEKLATATGPTDLHSAFPSLTEDEVGLLAFALVPSAGVEANPATGSNAGWLGVEAVILTAVLREDLALLARETDMESASPADVEELTPQMERDRTAYRVVSGRLQSRQSEATLAGLKDYADRLRDVERKLSVAERKLALALDAQAPDTVDDSTRPSAQAADLELLLQESAAQDALADAEWTNRITEEELYLDALDNKTEASRGGARKQVFVSTYDVKRERLRIRVLSAIAVVVFVGCVAVWMTHMRPEKSPLAVDLQQMSDTLILDDAFSVGPMMYAVVSHWSWDHMSVDERLGSVRALGLSAANSGYETVYLVDENRAELAMWTTRDGARLTTRPASEKPGPSS